MTMGSKMAIATASCKKQGEKSFKKGTAGEACRKRVSEGIAKKNTIVPGPAKKRRKK
jgi:hypothetical protein